MPTATCKDNYVSYGASTGFDADVMTSTLSRDQINTDMEQAVTDLYAGNTAVNARENVKTDLNTVLVADLNSRGKRCDRGCSVRC